MGRNGKIRIQCCINDRVIVIQPCDGIGILGGIELCGIGRVTGHRNDLRSPSVVEGVGELCGRSLGRSLAGVGGSLAVSNLLGLQRIAVAVDPCNGVLVDGLIELRGVFRITGH